MSNRLLAQSHTFLRFILASGEFSQIPLDLREQNVNNYVQVSLRSSFGLSIFRLFLKLLFMSSCACASGMNVHAGERDLARRRVGGAMGKDSFRVLSFLQSALLTQKGTLHNFAAI